ncbi:MAG: DUF1501 domain-containing protein [Pirellulales bacterium]
MDIITDLNRFKLDQVGDPEIETRIAAYETAYRMQSSAPELMEIREEPQHVLDLYGATPGTPSYANNCLLARRLVERGVRFVQLYHTNWDHHGGPTENLEEHLPSICREVDQASTAIVLELKQRGLLEETIVIWGGNSAARQWGNCRA